MVTKNGLRFGLGVFVICVTMLLAGRMSVGFAAEGSGMANETIGVAVIDVDFARR